MIKKLYLLLLLIIFAALAYSYYWVCEDAYISFRYAVNLAHGFGLRYNITDNPPVEGYTNFLWVVITALVELLHYSSELVMPILSALFGAACIILLSRILSEKLGNSAVFAALLTLILFPTFIIWSTGGLATMPYAFGVLSLFYLMVLKEGENRPLCIVASIFLALIRFDGLCFMLLIWGIAFLFNKQKRKLWYIYFTAGAFYAVYFVARAYYYQSLWPNTVYMKVSYDSPLYIPLIERGFKYAASYFLTSLSAFLAWAGFIVMFRKKVAKRYEVALLYLALLIYPISVGGDYMAFFRFYLPLSVVQTIPIAYLFSSLHKKRDWCCALVFVGLSFLSLFNYRLTLFGKEVNFNIFNKSIWSKLQFSYMYRDTLSEVEKYNIAKGVYNVRREKFSSALMKVSQPEDSVVLDTFGLIGYRTGLYVFDRYGLINTELRDLPIKKLFQAGHDKRVPQTYFLSRNPTFIEVRHNCKARRSYQGYTKLCVKIEEGEGIRDVLLFKRTDALREEDKPFIIS